MMQRFSLLLSFVLSMMTISLSQQVSSVNRNLRRGDERKLYNVNWLSITSYGGNPVDRLPLGECEGDCDNDDHCAGNLVCFQREKNEAIIGCNGGVEDNSRTDYCVDPKYMDTTPSAAPSSSPSSFPSTGPSSAPVIAEVIVPSTSPSSSPTNVPSAAPSAPSDNPSSSPSISPSQQPSFFPSSYPTETFNPSVSPSTIPSSGPSPSPIVDTVPSANPSNSPTNVPSATPSAPSNAPSSSPSVSPSQQPSFFPSTNPTETFHPSASPSTIPSSGPSAAPIIDTVPSSSPSVLPSSNPSVTPSTNPSHVPSASPTYLPMPIVSIPNPRANAPLGQCVGDCLFDSNCEEGLYCFQRSPYDEVPGCIGGGTDGTSNDFCTAYYYEPAPAPAPTPDMFKLKLYWEDGYYWQEEEFDRLWCMRCFGFPCDVGSKIEIANCTWDSIEYFDFVEVGGSADVIQIQLFDSDLCLERKNEYDVALDICDDTKSRQQWIELDGLDLDGEKFELTQVGFEKYCLTQHHHPKHGEILELQRCANARIDQSSFWQKY